MQDGLYSMINEFICEISRFEIQQKSGYPVQRDRYGRAATNFKQLGICSFSCDIDIGVGQFIAIWQGENYCIDIAENSLGSVTAFIL